MQTKTHFNFIHSCLPTRLVFLEGQKKAPLPAPENEEGNEIAQLKEMLKQAEAGEKTAIKEFKSKFENFQKKNKGKLKNEMGTFMMKMALKMESGSGGANFGNYKEISKTNPALRKKLDATMNKIRDLLQSPDKKTADDNIPTWEATNKAADEVRAEFEKQKAEAEKLVKEQSVATKPVDVKPVDVKPVDVKPVDVKPVDVKPVDVKPVTPDIQSQKIPESNEDLMSRIPNKFSFDLDINDSDSQDAIEGEAQQVLQDEVFEAVYRIATGKPLPDNYKTLGEGIWVPMRPKIDKSSQTVSITLSNSDKKSLIGMVKRLRSTGGVEGEVEPAQQQKDRRKTRLQSPISLENTDEQTPVVQEKQENTVDSETAALKKTFKKALDGDSEAIKDIEFDLATLGREEGSEGAALEKMAVTLNGGIDNNEKKPIFHQLAKMLKQAAENRESIAKAEWIDPEKNINELKKQIPELFNSSGNMIDGENKNAFYRLVEKRKDMTLIEYDNNKNKIPDGVDFIDQNGKVIYDKDPIKDGEILASFSYAKGDSALKSLKRFGLLAEDETQQLKLLKSKYPTLESRDFAFYQEVAATIEKGMKVERQERLIIVSLKEFNGIDSNDSAELLKNLVHYDKLKSLPQDSIFRQPENFQANFGFINKKEIDSFDDLIKKIDELLKVKEDQEQANSKSVAQESNVDKPETSSKELSSEIDQKAQATLRTVSEAYKDFRALDLDAVNVQLKQYNENWISKLQPDQKAEAYHQWAFCLSSLPQAQIVDALKRESHKNSGDAAFSATSFSIFLRMSNPHKGEAEVWLKSLAKAQAKMEKSVAVGEVKEKRRNDVTKLIEETISKIQKGVNKQAYKKLGFSVADGLSVKVRDIEGDKILIRIHEGTGYQDVLISSSGIEATHPINTPNYELKDGVIQKKKDVLASVVDDGLESDPYAVLKIGLSPKEIKYFDKSVGHIKSIFQSATFHAAGVGRGSGVYGFRAEVDGGRIFFDLKENNYAKEMAELVRDSSTKSITISETSVKAMRGSRDLRLSIDIKSNKISAVASEKFSASFKEHLELNAKNIDRLLNRLPIYELKKTDYKLVKEATQYFEAYEDGDPIKEEIANIAIWREISEKEQPHDFTDNKMLQYLENDINQLSGNTLDTLSDYYYRKFTKKGGGGGGVDKDKAIQYAKLTIEKTKKLKNDNSDNKELLEECEGVIKQNQKRIDELSIE
jgi:hypothetical protein